MGIIHTPPSTLCCDAGFLGRSVVSCGIVAPLLRSGLRRSGEGGAETFAGGGLVARIIGRVVAEGVVASGAGGSRLCG